MKRFIVGALALAMASTFAVPSFAQTYRSEARESRQDYRIHRQLRRGELTPREYRNLKRQQYRVDRAQRRASRDGVITWRERQRIDRMQNRASRNIYRKSHNGRYVY
ncbi:MAG: hypothetical protein INR68_02805 [Methylobacterium mesophilicum]|nr:hypothetical protein [Methylobacterium mesophilicum]